VRGRRGSTGAWLGNGTRSLSRPGGDDRRLGTFLFEQPRFYFFYDFRVRHWLQACSQQQPGGFVLCQRGVHGDKWLS